MAVPAVFLCLMNATLALTFGEFTYVVVGDENNPPITVMITDYPTAATGPVVIPEMIDDKPVTAIGNNAFFECVGVTNVSVPSTVTTIGISAFQKCVALSTINLPSNVTSIGANAFEGCTALTSIAIPAGLTTIASGTFSSCSGLTSVTVPSGITVVGSNAFAFCTGLTSVSLPAGVTALGNQAFRYCALESITIPSSVTTIGTGAFDNCTGLTSVVIPPSVTTLAAGIFSSCSGLTSVTLPSTLTSIQAQAFRYCSGLTGITLPSGPVNLTIGDRAFAACRGLLSVAIPANVTSIHFIAFAECSSLTSFVVDAGNLNYSSLNGFLLNKTRTNLITCPAGLSGELSVPAVVETIGNQAFRLCAKITGVTLPASVTSVGSKAFSTCDMLTHIVFLGGAPTLQFDSFEVMHPDYTTYYLNSNSSTGFTSPDWNGYPAYGINSLTPILNWLLANGFPGNADILSDPNGDGTNLLMAYALNLDPKLNLSGSVPQPVFGPEQMTLTFFAGTPGVNYSVEASDDLQEWTTEGVVLSEPDTNQMRTATVDRVEPGVYMRLAVSQ